MIRDFLSRIASRWLSSRKRDPREAIRARTRQMYAERGWPIPDVLREGHGG